MLRVLLDAEGELHGLPIAERSAVEYGTLYPMLATLHCTGWITARWESDEHWRTHPTGPSGRGRPKRRYHQLTCDGRRAAEHLLALKSHAIEALARPQTLACAASGATITERQGKSRPQPTVPADHTSPDRVSEDHRVGRRGKTRGKDEGAM